VAPLYDIAVWLFASVVPIALLAWVAWEAWRLVSPAWYIARGEYAKGRERSLALTKSWWRRAPGVELSAAYNAALCDLNEGKVEEALSRLIAVELADLDDNLRYAYASSMGLALVLLERDAKSAVEVLEDAVSLRLNAADLIALAHAQWLAGAVPEAKKTFEDAQALPALSGPRLARKTMLWFDKETHAAQIYMLRGWYFVRLGRFDEARSALARAAASPLDNVYRTRAVALLERVRTGTTMDDEAVPSSLGSIVLP